MELNDFLKCKKVRCVKAYGDCLTVGKEYSVLNIRMEVEVRDDEGGKYYWESDYFEPVIDDMPKSAENPLQGVELTPEFEAVPKFKVGDPVYFPRLSNKLCVIGEGQEDDYVDEVNGSKALAEMQSDLDFVYDQKTNSWLWDEKDCAPQLLYATPENYALLTQLYPHIEFEQPPKELKGSDLCFEKLRNGKKLVMCAVSDLSDEKAIKRLQDGDYCIRVIKDCDPTPYHFIDTHGIRHGFAVPLNDETGEPLTQAVLDE